MRSLISVRIFPYKLPLRTLYDYQMAQTRRGFCLICPRCQSSRCNRSHRRGAVDFALTALSLRPWRCRACEHRFFARIVPLTFSLYAHCPRCGNFDLQEIARNKVDSGSVVCLKRWLLVPAYRCAPCRERFFSIRPHRRILPLGDSESSRTASQGE